MGRSWVAVGPSALAACLLLSACTGTGAGEAAGPSPSTSAPSSNQALDVRNTTYRITCDGVVPGGFRATLVAGKARVLADVAETPYYDYFDVSFEASARGDVDDDGVPDTVVLLQCSPQPSNGILEEAQVISGKDGSLLAELPSPRTLRQGTILAPLYDPAGLSVENGDVVAVMRVYAPSDNHAGGPSLRTTVHWHWDGRSFVRLP